MKISKVLFTLSILLLSLGIIHAQKIVPADASDASSYSSSEKEKRNSNSGKKLSCVEAKAALDAPIFSNWKSRAEFNRLAAKAKIASAGVLECQGNKSCIDAYRKMTDYISKKQFETRPEFEKVFIEAHIKFSLMYPDCIKGEYVKKLKGTNYQEQIKANPQASKKEIQLAIFESRSVKDNSSSTADNVEQTLDQVEKINMECKRRVEQRVIEMNKKFLTQLMNPAVKSMERRLEMLTAHQKRIDQIREECVYSGMKSKFQSYKSVRQH